MAKKNIDSKAKIVEAALACYVDQGIVGTSFKDIAKKAKVHQPLIGYYFKSFEELFVEVLKLLADDLRGLGIKAIDDHPNDSHKALLDYSEAPLRWAHKKPELSPLWTFFYHMASYSPIFVELNTQLRRVGRDRISLLLYKIQEQKKLKLKKGLNTSELAYEVHAHITGTLVMAVTEKQDLRQAIKNCRKGTDALLKGAYENFS